jgi:hypothetical protein
MHADDIQDEEHVLFHCINPHVISLCRKYAFLFPQTGAHDVSTFLSQNNNKLCFFPMNQLLFMSRLAVALLDCLKDSIVNPVNKFSMSTHNAPIMD